MKFNNIKNSKKIDKIYSIFSIKNNIFLTKKTHFIIIIFIEKNNFFKKYFASIIFNFTFGHRNKKMNTTFTNTYFGFFYFSE